ncbi:peptidoglycan-binding protein [Propionicimonas sp.]|uniref:peptidoglycan-binding protein n=1 Tax=Propionicimonas sp. TaxID=1955623 RepID=UPI0039E62006
MSTSAKTKFIASLVTAAKNTQRKFGVPASVSIAQAIEASDWGSSSVVSKAKNYFDTPCSASMTAKQFAALADAQVGKPYVLGAEAAISNPDPAKFDCSELVQWLFGRSGNPITDLAASQYNVTKKVTGSPKVGDLVFLRNNPARSNGIGHVAVLTKKLSNGDWRIIEARGRAYGVVRTTLSYWKQRSYYAGLRRYSSFVLADGDSVTASAAKLYQTSCTTIGSTKYATFSSMTNSFYANAEAITSDSAYKAARAAMASIPKFVDEIAKVVRPKDAADYAKTIDGLIDTYNLTDYDVVPIKIVLESGDSGFRVTALQYLLKAAGYSTTITGKFDSGTTSAVKKFQKAQKLEVDGQAGQYTLDALFAKLSSGDSGTRVSALNALLAGLGYTTTSGSSFGSATTASLKSFQTTAGRSASGTADNNTWAALFMALDSTQPTVGGNAKVGQTLTAAAGSWGPGTVSLSYQWYRGKAAISGASAATYAVQGDDAGSALSVVVTGMRTGYTLTARTSSATDTVDDGTFTTAPAPTVSGSAKVGGTLTATAGTWKPTPTALSYQWLRDGTEIDKATKATYTVRAADAGATLTVSVTATRDGYKTVTKTSSDTDAVAKGTLSGKTPKISGSRSVGHKLTAIRGTWGPTGLKIGYQWYRGSKPISGATGKTYKLTKSDKGKRLTVVVTGTLDGYTTLAKRSAETGKIAG